MKITQAPLRNGNLLLRPSARKIPKGKDKNMPIIAKKNVSSRPPHSFVDTYGSIPTPSIPLSSMKSTTILTNQAINRFLLEIDQNRDM